MNTEIIASILVMAVIAAIIMVKYIVGICSEIQEDVRSISKGLIDSSLNKIKLAATHGIRFAALVDELKTILSYRIYSTDLGLTVEEQCLVINGILAQMVKLKKDMTSESTSLSPMDILRASGTHAYPRECDFRIIDEMYLDAISDMLDVTKDASRVMTPLEYSVIVAECRVRLENIGVEEGHQ